MSSLRFLVVLALVGSLLFVNIVRAEESAPNADQNSANTSPSPQASNESGSTTIVVENSNSKTTTAPAIEQAAGSTPMPPATVEKLIRMLSSEHSDPTEPVHTFCDWLKPICATLDKLTDKCIYRTNSQLRKFIQLDLANVCGSKDLAGDLKNSYKSFQRCAAKHWSANIDKEIDKIQVTRLEYLRANHHLKDSATTMLAQGDEEDARVVSELVDKVLGGEPGKPAASTDVKVVNLDNPSTSPAPHNKASSSSSSSSSTSAPNSATLIIHHSASASPTGGSSSPASHNGVKSHSNSDKQLLNDPGTLMVFVDETAKTTAAPKGSSSSVSSSSAPEHSAKSDGKGKHDNSVNIVKILQATSPAPSSSKATSTSTSGPAAAAAAAAADKDESNENKAESGKSSEFESLGISSSQKGKPASEHSNGTGKQTEKKVLISDSSNKLIGSLKKTLKLSTTVVPSPASSSGKPSATGNGSSTAKPQSDDDKMQAKAGALEGKLKEEREMMLKLLKKNQDELEALNAMKALTAQRQVAQHDHSDERVHQAEHQRQMSMDPIGHMIKHQQYEVKKKLSG